MLGLLLAGALAAGQPATPPAAGALPATPPAAGALPATPPAAGRQPPPPPAPVPLRELRLDAWDAALAERWGRLFAVAGRMLEQAPLDAEAYRLAGDAALMGGRLGEARRLLGKAQLLAPADATARLLRALDQPLGPPDPDAPPTPAAPGLQALAWLDLGENRHLSVPSFTCQCAARALAAAPGDERASAVRAALRCPPPATPPPAGR